MKRNDNTKDLDRRISRMLRNESAPVPEDEWFVRKTLNRLPSRQARAVGPAEIVAFLIVLVISVAVAVRELKMLVSLADPEGFNPMLLLSAAAVALFATLYISVPLIRKA